MTHPYQDHPFLTKLLVNSSMNSPSSLSRVPSTGQLSIQQDFMQEYVSFHLQYQHQLCNFYLYSQDLSQNSSSPFTDSLSYYSMGTPLPHGSYSSTPFKIEERTLKKEETDDGLSHYSGSELRSSIERIVRFFVENYKNEKNQEYFYERSLYYSNQTLLNLFDALSEKYSSAKKCREDMNRYVLRKAIIFLKNPPGKKKKINSKIASINFIKKYFQDQYDELTQTKQISNQKEAINFFLPYKKESKNKTANTEFTKEAFASETFYQDYLGFLKELDTILEADNKKKFKNFVDFLIVCVKKKTIEKIQTFKRPPWLKIWFNATKIIAYELLSAKNWKNFNKTHKGPKPVNSRKKVKLEMSC